MNKIEITTEDIRKAYFPKSLGSEPFSIGLMEQGAAIAQRDPLNVSDRELDMIATYDHGAALVYSQRREAARRLKAAPPPPPAPARPTHHYARSLTTKDIEEAEFTIEGLDRFAEKHAGCAVPIALWVTFIKVQREKREELEAKVDRIGDVVAALQTMPPTKGVEWGGVFEQGSTYACGTLVTRNGGLWLSLRQTTQTPGADPVSWKLVCKEGRAQP